MQLCWRYLRMQRCHTPQCTCCYSATGVSDITLRRCVAERVCNEFQALRCTAHLRNLRAAAHAAQVATVP